MHLAALSRTLGILSLVLCVGAILGGLKDTRLLLAGPFSGMIVGFAGHRLNIRDSRDPHLRDEDLRTRQSRLPMLGLVCNALVFSAYGGSLLVLAILR